MNGQALQITHCPEEIQILTFTIMGVRMGVDATQVAEIMEIAAAESRGPAVYHFHEKVPFGEVPVTYHSPKAIMIKEESAAYAIVIDNPEDVTSVNVRCIQPLPPLIAMNSATRLFWGAVADNEGIVLLVDFFKTWQPQHEQRKNDVTLREERGEKT